MGLPIIARKIHGLIISVFQWFQMHVLGKTHTLHFKFLFLLLYKNGFKVRIPLHNYNSSI